ncbi:SDR family oxidoreductase [Pseudoalteromonas luteoviolacea]|uniref:3-ketoacyl-ACP reductase n=1 Tax=Pseudoalteromonas luteoviolacea S4054 TaxID=1129367 RepID=A0A0F6A8N4_9GAMM|nr:SDR family oxidoreductase [Pseudoalteromonas luteoviolacea]AOT08877.1 3-ketoacyl-ACP reductase [Pseudoalteromonas luteoviolacea]AOT13790.1 3-ketoacyl-ACP reductase [Pseudoalteromonas luteoviolacea]AOT18704.1 3-ketoacyl-ACP reductase [Pseudoalteromonas luteoviolacea]KKE81764.1 3-ketoacyl-ACP reductase [Pseudoalteromonas luteoviolacea S4054]KZN68002.1 3-ketoacyl-ACP reductase [Pseudoalteromonas luteoviolacea S4047-1]
MNVENKTVVITGGAQGLGLAMAHKMASLGANLALVDMQEEVLHAAVEELSQFDVTVRTYVANVSIESNVEEVFDKIVEDFGSLSVLINNAGILRDGLFVKVKEGEVINKMSLDQFQSLMDVNLTGVFLCGREAAVKMIEADQGGVIINMSSVARAGNIGQTNYSAAKAGVVAMTTTWAKELGRYGIRVGAIAPGVIRTKMTDAMKPEAKERLVKMKPVGRLGEAQEIAHTAQYIIENEFFTGRVVEIDGGIRL